MRASPRSKRSCGTTRSPAAQLVSPRVPRPVGCAGVRSAVAILAVMGVALYAMGQPLWCAGGEPWLWSAEVWSRHNSQHLFDPYTLSHVSHGILFAVFLRAVLPAPV